MACWSEYEAISGRVEGVFAVYFIHMYKEEHTVWAAAVGGRPNREMWGPNSLLIGPLSQPR